MEGKITEDKRRRFSTAFKLKMAETAVCEEASTTELALRREHQPGGGLVAAVLGGDARGYRKAVSATADLVSLAKIGVGLLPHPRQSGM